MTRPLKELCLAQFPILIISTLAQENLFAFYFPQIDHSVQRIQRRFRTKMAAIQSLKDKFHDIISNQQSNLEFFLEPSNAKRYFREMFSTVLQPGYHIAVYCRDKKIFHHGIYLGGAEVMHCPMSGKQSIQTCSISNFFGEETSSFYLIGHPQYGEEYNDRTLLFANILKDLPDDYVFQQYDLLNWNCECFPWYCVTHGIISKSEQVCQLWNEMNENLEAALSIAVAAHSTRWCIFM
jgi:hypothetical protein